MATNNSTSRLTFKYRLSPTRAQIAYLDSQLAEACRLYNAALEERIGAWKIARTPINYYIQANQLKAIRAAGDLTLTNFSCCQDVLRRVDKTFKSFYRRVKAGAKRPGFPRFRPVRRYDSLTFPSYGDGCRLLPSGRLHVQGTEPIRVRLHRPLAGTVKTVTIKRDADRWFVCFSVIVESNPLPVSDERIGIDMGLTHFATFSDGTQINNQRHARQAEALIRRAQRSVSRRKKGSHRRRKAVRLFQRVHSRVRNQRTDFHHKTSRTLVNRYGYIAVEDLNVKGMGAGILAKSIRDAGWSSFISKLAYKAENAGRVLIKVDPRGTSQHCTCGAHVPKTLSQRWHQCPECGLSAARDHVSAQVILRLAGFPPSRANVADRTACVA